MSRPGQPAYCDNGVDVTGVDLARLTHRGAVLGAVSGSAELTGIYRAGTLRVTGQRVPVSPRPDVYDDVPPCPAPAGGWPSAPDASGNLDQAAVLTYEREHRGVVVERALLRPSARQVVMYVLTVGSPARSGTHWSLLSRPGLRGEV